MKAMKRVEVILPEGETDKLIQAIEGTGISGYTLIHSVSGRGDRGRLPPSRATESPGLATGGGRTVGAAMGLAMLMENGMGNSEQPAGPAQCDLRTTVVLNCVLA